MAINGLGGLIQILSEYIDATGNFAVILYIIEIFIGLLLPAVQEVRA